MGGWVGGYLKGGARNTELDSNDVHDVQVKVWSTADGTCLHTFYVDRRGRHVIQTRMQVYVYETFPSVVGVKCILVAQSLGVIFISGLRQVLGVWAFLSCC